MWYTNFVIRSTLIFLLIFNRLFLTKIHSWLGGIQIRFSTLVCLLSIIEDGIRGVILIIYLIEWFLLLFFIFAFTLELLISFPFSSMLLRWTRFILRRYIYYSVIVLSERFWFELFNRQLQQFLGNWLVFRIHEFLISKIKLHVVDAF